MPASPYDGKPRVEIAAAVADRPCHRCGAPTIVRYAGTDRYVCPPCLNKAVPSPRDYTLSGGHRRTWWGRMIRAIFRWGKR